MQNYHPLRIRVRSLVKKRHSWNYLVNTKRREGGALVRKCKGRIQIVAWWNAQDVVWWNTKEIVCGRRGHHRSRASLPLNLHCCLGRRIKPRHALDSGTTTLWRGCTSLTRVTQHADIAKTTILADTSKAHGQGILMVRLRPVGFRRFIPRALVPNIAYGLCCDTRLYRKTIRQSVALLSVDLGLKDLDRLSMHS